MRLAFVDDPPLQCDAVGVIATVLTHPELSMPMIELNVSKLRKQEEKELAAKIKSEVRNRAQFENFFSFRAVRQEAVQGV